MKNLYLDLHVLQTVPPSCINRDDTGSPKMAVYGGVNRARVSSQSWKRAMRLMFENLFKQEQVGVRTKYVIEMVVDALNALGYQGNAEKDAKAGLEKAGIKINKDDKADALFFMSRPQAEKIAQLIKDGEEDKKAYNAALSQAPAIDMVLFGRMVASDASLNYDATSQVAHSISTHEVRNEYDYFTAVDDFSQDDHAGAGHLGTVEYYSATLYRYATINVTELAKHLGADSIEAVQGFIKAFLLSMPTGKQNTFANRTMPSYVYATLREDQPVNLVGAFEKPTLAGHDGFVEKSIKALESYAESLYSQFNCAPKVAYVIGKGGADFATNVSLEALVNNLADDIKSRM